MEVPVVFRIMFVFSLLILGEANAEPLAVRHGYSKAREAAERKPAVASSIKGRSGWGFEVGMVGQKNNALNDVLGFNVRYGARLQAFIPLWGRFSLNPSLGYFIKNEGTDLVSVLQHHMEGGATLFYVPSPDSNLSFMVGFANRVDVMLTSLSVGNASSDVSDVGIQYRLGAAAGLRVKSGTKTTFILQAELTFPVDDGQRPFAGVTLGLLFH